ncbi:MAG: hypothetical protein Ct9H90mP16_07170 [Candidatus Poseidoniales archaeon]|nr:MAG: hypothetical protein Ct9H90mP16_07170 [Candidatus Poseidoniales archaeon]
MVIDELRIHPSDDGQFLIYTIPGLIALILSIGMMIALIMRPEWYVINTVGVLVGAGTITMLGVSFVPWIIIIFMVLAAIYDAWAVYKSKHMLELADTMVNLELPVMLVAPQKPTRGRIQMARPETPIDGSPMPPSTQKRHGRNHVDGVGRRHFPWIAVYFCHVLASRCGGATRMVRSCMGCDWDHDWQSGWLLCTHDICRSRQATGWIAIAKRGCDSRILHLWNDFHR